jgi:hypothetical protein
LRVERIETVDGRGELFRAGIVVCRCRRFSRERQRRTDQNPSEQDRPASGFPGSQRILSVPLWGLSGSVTIGPKKGLALQFATETSISRRGFVKLGLAANKVVMMMICAGKLGCRLFVFGRGMFAGHRIGGMHGARVGAVVPECVAMSRHSRAARTVRRTATAQSCARATATHMSAAATTTMSATATATATATAATMATATAAATATAGA